MASGNTLWLTLQRRENLILHAFSFFANRGLPFVASIVIARILGASEFGHYITTITLFMALSIFVDAGLAVAGTKIIARQPSTDRHVVAVALLSVIMICFGLGMLVAAALTLFAEDLASLALGDIGLTPFVLAGAVFVPASALTSVATAALQGALQYRKIAIAGTVGGIAFLVCAINSALTGDALTAVWGAAFGTLIRAMALLGAAIGLFRNIDFSRNISQSILLNSKSLWDVALPASLAALTFAPVNGIVMLLLFRSTNGASEAGAYGLTLQFFAIAMMAPGMLTQYVLPKLARNHDHASQIQEMLRYIAMASFACVIIAVPTAILAAAVLRQFSPEFAGYSASLQWIMLAAVITAPQGVLSNYLLAASRDWIRVGTRILWAGAVLGPALTADQLDANTMAKIYAAAGAALFTSQILVVLSFKIRVRTQ